MGQGGGVAGSLELGKSTKLFNPEAFLTSSLCLSVCLSLCLCLSFTFRKLTLDAECRIDFRGQRKLVVRRLTDFC